MSDLCFDGAPMPPPARVDTSGFDFWADGAPLLMAGGPEPVDGSEIVVETGEVTVLVGVAVFVEGEEIDVETGDVTVDAQEIHQAAEVFVVGEEILIETGDVEAVGAAYSVFPFRPNWVNNPNHGQLDDHTFDSVGVGSFTPWKPTGRVRRKATYEFLLGDREEIAEWQDWFRDRGQRLHGFWLPLYLNDYGLTEDATAGATELRIKRIGLTEKFNYSAQFSRLALVTREAIEKYTITDVAVDGDEEVITLESQIENDVVARRTVCCGLMLARAEGDDYGVKYVTDSIATVNMTFVEIPMEIDAPAETSRPRYLYQITRGNLVWRFTNWLSDLVLGGEEWAAADIEHGEINADVGFDVEPIDLEIGTDDEENPFRVLLDPNLSEKIEVEIFRSDGLTVDLSAPIYKGEAGDAQFGSNGRITVRLSSPFRIGENEAPQIMLQRTCNLRLYSPGCGLTAEDWRTDGEITAVNAAPPWIEADEFEDKAVAEADLNWFALGRVVVGNETRLCTGQDGNRLYLNAAFSSAVEAGNEASAFAGCDKRAGTCAGKFGNIENHLAFPLIPNRNPQFEQLQTPRPSGGKK